MGVRSVPAMGFHSERGPTVSSTGSGISGSSKSRAWIPKRPKTSPTLPRKVPGDPVAAETDSQFVLTITERTGSLFALGLWGPNARAILEVVTDVDV